MTGLALVITRVGWFVTFIQIAGGSYLIYLGLAAWITCQGKVIDVANAPRMTKSIGGFRTGIIVELSNPKGIAFFVSFFAVAVPIETELWAKGAVLIGGFLLEVLWYGTVAHLFSTRPIQVLYQKYANWIERITGTLLAGFGISMIVEKI
ncbi:lysE type translocator family protein [Candidatus Erwinia dacicola]|uniref:LysE type translocator family protein n=2 Tax=Candidatus Erwinia dacicola TaxID=252393 RepID=A0A328TH22_9GAMM|nr:lysE type translocator family protein [Candidatus Erwinia dacicola]